MTKYLPCVKPWINHLPPVWKIVFLVTSGMYYHLIISYLYFHLHLLHSFEVDWSIIWFRFLIVFYATLCRSGGFNYWSLSSIRSSNVKVFSHMRVWYIFVWSNSVNVYCPCVYGSCGKELSRQEGWYWQHRLYFRPDLQYLIDIDFQDRALLYFQISQTWGHIWEVCCFLPHCFKRAVSVLPSQPSRSLPRFAHSCHLKTFKFASISIVTGTAWETQNVLEWTMRYKRKYVGLCSRPVLE